MKRLYKISSLLLIAALSCSLGLARGPKKRLRKFLPKKVTPVSMELVVGGHGDFANRYGSKDHFNPFGDFMIGARIYTADNKVYGTPGIGGGIFSWDNFDIEVIGGSFAHSALLRSQVSIFDPDRVPNHRVRLRVSFKGLPGTSQEIEVPLDFSYSYRLRSTMPTAPDGEEVCRVAPKGPDGRDHRKCDGDDGRDGRRGQPGGHGFDGALGPDIEVRLFPYDDLNSDDMVIEAHEVNLQTGQVRKRWFKPGQSKLTVISRGGKGGDGGDGQRGGRGGKGGDGGQIGDEKHVTIDASGGNGGNGGRGGHGGHGGVGGDGGQVTVIFHPDLMNHLGSIVAISEGGSGGCGGDGGRGGDAGSGGDGTEADGRSGRKGGCGQDGLNGPAGFSGPPVRWVPMDVGA